MSLGSRGRDSEYWKEVIPRNPIKIYAPRHCDTVAIPKSGEEWGLINKDVFRLPRLLLLLLLSAEVKPAGVIPK